MSAAALDGISFVRIDGAPMSLGDFAGRVLLIVNTASECGFTPQYAGLQALHERFGSLGLTVIGFPCNQFGRQEPGADTEIAAFCSNNYGVSFPLGARIEVNGPAAHPLFVALKVRAPGLLGSTAIKWNFTKFLVDRRRQTVSRYAPSTPPDALAAEVERLLAQTPI